MQTVKITVNGTLYEEMISPRMLLVDFIRDRLALT